MQSHVVKTSGFEGPLDLLLQLIEAKKLSINDISLASVTQDFISHVESLRYSKDHITNFLVVAATLTLIKSTSLLPGISVSHDEKHLIVELRLRLALLSLYKKVSRNVENLFGPRQIFYQENRPLHAVKFFSHPEISKSSLQASLSRVIEDFPQEKDVREEVKVEKIISLEEMIQNITNRIQKSQIFSFNSFTQKDDVIKNRKKKIEIIVGFLAVLELIRQELISVTQNDAYSDITVVNRL